MPIVSIIVPFHNVEDYIEECLNSLISQTLEDIEIILINDASNDKSMSAAQSYAEKDARIKIIDLEQQKGQGYARNIGIDAATGEYIGFVDCDDFIEPEMYKKLYNAAKENCTEITMCAAAEYDDLNKTYKSSNYYSLDVLGKFADNVFSGEDAKGEILDTAAVIWNKIYKREYLLNTGEKFPEGFIYEDLPFFTGTFLNAQRMNIVWEILYYYRVNRKKSTMMRFDNKILDRIPMVSLTLQKIKKYPYFKDIKEMVHGWVINDLFYRYGLLHERYHKEYYFMMKKVFESLEIDNSKNPYWKSIYYYQGYELVINNTFEEFNKKVLNKYLDIKNIENGLIKSIDSRLNVLYETLNQNYTYTNEKVSNAEENIKKTKSDIMCEIEKNISKLTEDTDDKVLKIYEEISKSYQYTNKKAEDAKIVSCLSIDEKISQVYEEITKNYKYIDEKAAAVKTSIENSADKKISKIYSEITKNYKYTENLNKNLNAVITADLKETANLLNSKMTKKSEEQMLKLKNDLLEAVKCAEITAEQTKKELQKDLSEARIYIKQQTAEYTDVKTAKTARELEFMIDSRFEKLQNEILKIRSALNAQHAKLNNFLKFKQP